MNDSPELKTGESCFTTREILTKAAEHGGLRLPKGARRAITEPLGYYPLNQETLALLSSKGIKAQLRADCSYNILTLVDEQSPTGQNYWNFNQADTNHVELCVGLVESERERGVRLSPCAFSDLLSPDSLLPHFRMFKILIDHDDQAPAIAKKIAGSKDGKVVIGWTTLGLGGIRSIRTLFREFTVGHAIFIEMGEKHHIFDPSPFIPFHCQPGEEVWITEPAQPSIFRAWGAQWKKFRARLDIES